MKILYVRSRFVEKPNFYWPQALRSNMGPPNVNGGHIVNSLDTLAQRDLLVRKAAYRWIVEHQEWGGQVLFTLLAVKHKR
jgi:hypothetical protein